MKKISLAPIPHPSATRRHICRHRFRKLSALMAVLVLSSSCTLPERTYHKPISLPSSFSHSGTTELEEKWWKGFQDRQLDALMEEALSENFTLLAAYDRLNQTKALLQQDEASLLPNLTASGEGEHSTEYASSSQGSSNEFYLGLESEYELDLWGKVRANITAAKLDMEISRADLQTGAISLSAEVAERWYTLVEIQCQLELLEKQINTNNKGLQLITAQVRTGLAPMADILQQRQLLETNTAQKIQLFSEKRQAENNLNILLGRPPNSGTFSLPTTMIELPTLPKTGIPVACLFNRPDIQSAMLEAQAADARVAAAMADRFPTLTFSVTLESSTSRISDLFNPFFTSLIADIVAPLFDGGDRKAEVERTKALTEEKLHIFEQALITAASEVENALVVEQQQQLYLASLQKQLTLAQQTIAQVKLRYIKGVESYERVLSALISEQTLEKSILSAHRILLINRIQLCRALSGGWQLAPPPLGPSSDQ